MRVERVNCSECFSYVYLITTFDLLAPGQPKSEFASFYFKNIVKHYSSNTNFNIYRWVSRNEVCELTINLFVEMVLEEGRTWI